MESWKDIPNYEGLYIVSDNGVVVSLNYNNTGVSGKLKPAIDKDGYNRVTLAMEGVNKSFFVHRLMAASFLGLDMADRNMEVDHIDRNVSNNKIKNLQVLTAREHRQKTAREKKKSSIYTGVTWVDRDSRWCAQIYLDGIRKHIGYFKTEHEAHMAYEEFRKNWSKNVELKSRKEDVDTK